MALINVSEFTFETDTNDSNGQPITVTGNVSVAGGVGIFNDTAGIANLSQIITADTDIGDNADFVMTLSGFRLSSAGCLYLIAFGDIGAGTGFLVMVNGENGYFQIVFYNAGVPAGYDVWETSGFLSAHTFVLTRTAGIYSLTSDGVPCTKGFGTLDGVTLPSFVGQQYILGGFEAAGLIAYIENVKFEADRIPATVTLTYNGNGNTTGTAPTGGTFDPNASVTVSAIGDLARTNCNFLEWNTAADGSGTGYDPAETFTITTNTTLYAIWGRHFLVNDVVRNNNDTYWCKVEHDASAASEPGVGASWETYWGKGVDLSGKADKVSISPDPTGYVATFDSTGNLAVSDRQVSTDIPPDPTAANDFIVADGTPAWVKKTLEETKTILGVGSAIHNNLDGLQGGESSPEEYYHLNGDDYTALTAATAQLQELQTDGNPEFASEVVTGDHPGGEVFQVVNVLFGTTESPVLSPDDSPDGTLYFQYTEQEDIMSWEVKVYIDQDQTDIGLVNATWTDPNEALGVFTYSERV